MHSERWWENRLVFRITTRETKYTGSKIWLYDLSLLRRSKISEKTVSKNLQKSNDDGNSSKNVTQKWICAVSNFIAFIPALLIWQMLVIISGVAFQRTLSKFTKRKRKSLSCVHDLHKYEIRKFLVVVVKWRQRSVQESVMHVQSCCFAILNQLLFCRFRCVVFV